MIFLNTLSWVLDPRLYLYVQVLFSYVSLYKYIFMCVCRHFHVVPLCSRHDLIDSRSYYPGPLFPSSLASQATWFGTLDVQMRSLFSMSGMVSLITSDSMHHFLSEVPYLMEHLVYLVQTLQQLDCVSFKDIRFRLVLSWFMTQSFFSIRVSVWHLDQLAFYNLSLLWTSTILIRGSLPRP